MKRSKRNIYSIISLLVLLVVTACAPVGGGKGAVIYQDEHIAQDTVWSGQIVIDGSVKVAKDATLTITPGTDILFVPRDADQDGLGDAVLVVEGRIKAIGTRQEPIRFRSAADNPQPGDWLEIRVDFSKEVYLRYCEIRDSAYTLHAHFTRGTVEDCHIHNNIDGCRLGQATFTFRNNLIENNQGKGINFRNSTVTAHHNIIRYNGSGVFLFENDRDFDIYFNNFYGNLDNFRLGDFYTQDVSVHDNWWGTADIVAAKKTIYDRSQDSEIGSVAINPAESWIEGTGPRDQVEIAEAWRFQTDGYVDADPVVYGDKLYVASWDGSLTALDATGMKLWQVSLGDTIDATPVVADGLIYLQTWSREVYAIDAESGTVRWRFDYSPSPADDHRQGSLLVIDTMVLVPAWNGTLFALDAQSGEKLWEFQGEQPFRSQPAYDGESIYLASGAGLISALKLSGELVWQHALEAPLLRSPVVVPDGVVVVSRAGQVVAFSRDGQVLWQRDLAEVCYYGSPIVSGNQLFIATAGNGLWKLDAKDGDVIWRAELAGPSYASPLLDSGRIFVGDNSGALSVFGTDSGQLLARYDLEREIQSRPSLWGKSLVIGSRDHNVHALRLVNGQLESRKNLHR